VAPNTATCSVPGCTVKVAGSSVAVDDVAASVVSGAAVLAVPAESLLHEAVASADTRRATARRLFMRASIPFIAPWARMLA